MEGRGLGLGFREANGAFGAALEAVLNSNSPLKHLNKHYVVTRTLLIAVWFKSENLHSMSHLPSISAQNTEVHGATLRHVRSP